jgi:sulfatase maturation enzyme AslB (radical SAM superfamily)
MENYIKNKKLDNFVICDQDVILNTTYINLLTTNQCNNACWYCCSDCQYKKDTYEYFPDESFSRLLQFIDVQGNPSLDLHFIGGEPTLHPKLKEWCTILEERYGFSLDMHMTTNAMKPLDYWRDFPMRRPNGTVTCSFHSDFVRDVDKWFDSMRLLRDNNSLQAIFLMAQKDNLDLLSGLYDKYRKELPVKINPIFQCKDTPEWRAFEKRGFEVQNEHKETLQNYCNTDVQVLYSDGTRDDDNFDSYNNFQGMMCNSGFVVLPNGDVTYCYADTKSMLNLCHDEPKKIDKWHVCKFNFCNCEFEFQKCSIQYYLRNVKCK